MNYRSGSGRQFNTAPPAPGSASATLVVIFTCELFGCIDEIMFSLIANVFPATLFSGPEETVLSRQSLQEAAGVPEKNHC
jgi:hypothetical protein